MGNDQMICCNKPPMDERVRDYSQTRILIHTHRKLFPFISVLQYKNQRWHDLILNILSRNTDNNYDKYISDYQRSKQRLLYIETQLKVQGHLLSAIFFAYVDRKFAEANKSSLYMSQSQIIIDVRDSFSSQFQQMASSFIKSSDDHKEISRMVEDIQSFSKFFGKTVQLYFKIDELQDDEENPCTADLVLLIVKTLFEHKSFYDRVKAIYDRRLITMTKQYKEGIRKLQMMNLSYFEIEKKYQLQDYTQCIAQLQQISQCMVPIDKMRCLLRAVELVSAKQGYGAEQLMAMLLYVLSQSNIEKFITDIKICEHFVTKQYMNDQIGYVLTSFMIAVQHIIEVSQNNQL